MSRIDHYFWVWVLATGRPLRFQARDHVLFAGMGVFMFSTNYALFLYATNWITTGVLAVVFSLNTIINPVNAAIFHSERISRSLLTGAAIGISGIGLIFWPEISAVEADAYTWFGLGISIVAAYLFSLGNMCPSWRSVVAWPFAPRMRGA